MMQIAPTKSRLFTLSLGLLLSWSGMPNEAKAAGTNVLVVPLAGDITKDNAAQFAVKVRFALEEKNNQVNVQLGEVNWESGTRDPISDQIGRIIGQQSARILLKYKGQTPDWADYQIVRVNLEQQLGSRVSIEMQNSSPAWYGNAGDVRERGKLLAQGTVLVVVDITPHEQEGVQMNTLMWSANGPELDAATKDFSPQLKKQVGSGGRVARCSELTFEAAQSIAPSSIGTLNKKSDSVVCIRLLPGGTFLMNTASWSAQSIAGEGSLKEVADEFANLYSSKGGARAKPAPVVVEKPSKTRDPGPNYSAMWGWQLGVPTFVGGAGLEGGIATDDALFGLIGLRGEFNASLVEGSVAGGVPVVMFTQLGKVKRDERKPTFRPEFNLGVRYAGPYQGTGPTFGFGLIGWNAARNNKLNFAVRLNTFLNRCHMELSNNDNPSLLSDCRDMYAATGEIPLSKWSFYPQLTFGERYWGKPNTPLWKGRK